MIDTQRESELARQERFRSVYLAHYQQVYMYFRRRTDVETARDGTADTFLVAWRRFDELPGEDRMLPWLYGTARRVLANQWRSRRRSDQLQEKLTGMGSDPQPGPEDIVVPAAHVQAVLDALGRLRRDDCEIIRLAEWEGLSHREIATVLGCTTHAVDQRMHRARGRLAKQLGLDSSTAGIATAEGGAG